MLLNTINAEWIKLRSTKSFYWTTALIVLFGIGWAMLMGFANGYAFQQALDDQDAETIASLGDPADLFDASNGVSGLGLFGIMIVIIQAVILVTGEYGNGTAKLAALAAPKRWQMPAAKVIVYGVISATVFFVMSIVSIGLTKLMADAQLDDTSLTEGLSMSADGAWSVVLLMTLAAVLIVMISIGVGYILRRTVGAVALLLLWALLLEDLVGMIPKVGDWVTPYLPFKNLNAGIYQSALDDAPWGIGGSVIYFVAWAMIIYVAGVVVLRRRDV